jgi:phage terminase large subunit GpA-like protein
MKKHSKRVVDIAPNTAELVARCLATVRPPPTLTLSQWADRERRLSPEASAEPGQWHTDKAPYQREIMDAIGDPHIRDVLIMSAAQIGKTDIILNAIGYYMDYTPAPILVMQPTINMGQTFSKDRLAPMLRDTPALKNKVDTKSRYSGNTIMQKVFPGGRITIVGANSATDLAGRPIKVLLADEVDRYPPSAGTEGDPLSLARKRQTAFWDRKTVMVSTPTIKGKSRIEKQYAVSTQEEWNVPCPECGHLQPLVWGNVIFDKENPKNVTYRCERCGCLAGEYDWKKQGKCGKFIANKPDAEERGFHLNTLASPFCHWDEMVKKFLLAKDALDHGDPELMKTWVNTELGEVWEEPGERVDDTELISRREIYAAEVPDDVIVLTAAVDVQDDRFEAEIVGWGEGKESWGIRYQKIYGDMLKQQVWDDLDDFLLRSWRKADGTTLQPLACCIDSGGHHTDQVYRFAQERLARRVFAIKGMGGANVPFIRNPTRNNRVKVPLFIIGVDAGKGLVYQRLKVAAKGANYCHFPLNEEAGYDEDYFKGLTSEQMVIRFRKGRPVIVWELKEGLKRNEPLDLRNYNTAALEIANPILKKPEEAEVQPARRAGRRVVSGGI